MHPVECLRGIIDALPDDAQDNVLRLFDSAMALVEGREEKNSLKRAKTAEAALRDCMLRLTAITKEHDACKSSQAALANKQRQLDRLNFEMQHMKFELKKLKDVEKSRDNIHKELGVVRKESNSMVRQHREVCDKLERVTLDNVVLQKQVRRLRVELELLTQNHKREVALTERRHELEKQRFDDELASCRYQAELEAVRQKENHEEEIRKLCKSHHNDLEAAHAEYSRAANLSQSSSRISSDFQDMLALLLPNENLRCDTTRSEDECMLCLDEIPSVKLYPCQEKTLCRPCALRLLNETNFIK